VALKAVEFCRNMNFFNIILEGDSLIVVKTLNSRDDSWCCYGQIVHDIVEVQLF
jgi:ribonuclease HI